MFSLRPHFGACALALAAIALPGLAAAQPSAGGSYTFTVSAMGGIGGSIDEDRAGYGNRALQVGFSVATESNADIAARVGRLSFGSGEVVGNLFDLDVTYATVAGEYTFGERGYQSGIFLGVGVYRLEGSRRFTGQAVSTSEVGLTAGVTGEFDLSERVGIVGELTAHLLPSAEVELFASGLVGLAFYIR